jgi:hypothetical protein
LSKELVEFFEGYIAVLVKVHAVVQLVELVVVSQQQHLERERLPNRARDE